MRVKWECERAAAVRQHAHVVQVRQEGNKYQQLYAEHQLLLQKLKDVRQQETEGYEKVAVELQKLREDNAGVTADAAAAREALAVAQEQLKEERREGQARAERAAEGVRNELQRAHVAAQAEAGRGRTALLGQCSGSMDRLAEPVFALQVPPPQPRGSLAALRAGPPSPHSSKRDINDVWGPGVLCDT